MRSSASSARAKTFIEFPVDRSCYMELHDECRVELTTFNWLNQEPVAQMIYATNALVRFSPMGHARRARREDDRQAQRSR